MSQSFISYNFNDYFDIVLYWNILLHITVDMEQLTYNKSIKEAFIETSLIDCTNK